MLEEKSVQQTKKLDTGNLFKPEPLTEREICGFGCEVVSLTNCMSPRWTI